MNTPEKITYFLIVAYITAFCALAIGGPSFIGAVAGLAGKLLF